MPKSTGILIDPATGDLDVRPGRGIVIGEVTHQNQGVILAAGKGEFKEWPTLGVGIGDILGDDDLTGWEREIALQMERDGMRVKRVALDLEHRKITVDAHYDN